MVTTADIRAAARAGDRARAEALLATLIAEVTGETPCDLRLNADRYSLNSVNGFYRSATGGERFFKFHQEEGEEEGVSEYYNAQVLAEAGYPVTMPLFAETRPGRQILVYERMSTPRFSDLCSDIEKGQSAGAVAQAEAAIRAQEAADSAFAAIALGHLHRSEDPADLAQPIFQLFHLRLQDRPGGPLGGRFARFYAGQRVVWPGLEGDFDHLATLPWRIDGLDYPTPMAEAFDTARRRLQPGRFLPGPAFPAHGDAHNANVWFTGDSLTLFDPAFAHGAVPALLAEVKATFHNIFAHPFWLYDPEACSARFAPRARLVDGVIEVETGFEPGPLRHAFLRSKATRFWRPLLGELAARDQLDPEWRAQLRSALFACPTLVMSLLAGAGSHTPESSLIGLAQAMRAAAPPVSGEDDFTRFLDLADPAITTPGGSDA